MCAGLTVMPDGDFVFSKAHAYTSNLEQQINTIVLDSIVFGTQIQWSRGRKIYTGFELVVYLVKYNPIKYNCRI